MSGSPQQGEAWGSLTSLRPLLTSTTAQGRRLAHWGCSRDAPESPASSEFPEAPPLPSPSQLWNVAVPRWRLTLSLQPGPPATR